MGEVFRARDTRLGREVAIKVLPAAFAADPERLHRFEQEARATAALNHPHILALYDIGTHEGRPYLVEELLEGETLREVLTRRSATQRQVLAWTVQIASGLAAAHEKGIVHRDLKPENLFLTTDGRIKILDFGLAKRAVQGEVDGAAPTESSPTEAGLVVGTLAYLSPEQAEGRPVDVRSDVFSFGVVLYELLAKKHPFRRETSAGTLAAILREEPSSLSSLDPSIPRALDRLVAKCLEKTKEERFRDAHDLGVALEAVLAAPTGSAILEEIEERSPYPGIASFTERDAALFFGREAEVESLWDRIRSRPLLAVIGPSGAGKTSFLRAGVIPARPEGWAAIVATPGASPFRGLGQALAPELASDPESLRLLVDVGDPETAFQLVSRWRQSRGDVLLVLDQFEELFTLCPGEVQARFAALVARLVDEAGAHVVLSLRDDFLMRCHEQPPLARVFRELTPLGPLTDEGLRRALVEPAAKRGYRFEDDSLVDEMVEVVEGERGALPLLAFAVSRLWEKRDRKRRLLTRDAYARAGGVAGALAQHAEAALERIGAERQGLVREVFRNLVTAQGTRAVMGREELLSAFRDRAGAEGVLRQLLDARLLTSYELEAEAGAPNLDRIEIVHESLLKAWPRLVRWQAQEEEGTVLRDQLRQAARLWEEKGRTSDLLWTGTAFQEFELWRGRYAGALTALEEDFGRALRARARRRRRLQTGAAATVIVALAAVAVVVGVLLRQARAEAQRAEAAKLLAIGQERLAADPTEALAYATASLALADNPEARVFALRLLWEAPPALELVDPPGSTWTPVFGPDGRRLAVGGYRSNSLVFDEGGGPPHVLADHWGNPSWVGDRLTLLEDGRRVSVWSPSDYRLERTIELGAGTVANSVGARLFLRTAIGAMGPQGSAGWWLRSWAPGEEVPVDLGRAPNGGFGPGGTSWVTTKGATLLAHPVPFSARAAATVMGEHPPEITKLYSMGGKEILTFNGAGAMRVFKVEPGAAPVVEDLPTPAGAQPPALGLGDGGWILGDAPGAVRNVQLWERGSWAAARPFVPRRDLSWANAKHSLHPSGDWLVVSTAAHSRLTFWPLRGPRPRVVDSAVFGARDMASKGLVFSPDGRWLATASMGEIRLWPLTPGSTTARTLRVPRGGGRSIAFDPRGRFLFCVGGALWVLPLDGRPPVQLEGFERVPWMWAAAVSPSGRQVATSYGTGEGDKTLRVWDLETGATRAFEVGATVSLAFADESTLYSDGYGGIRRWDLDNGRQEVVLPPSAEKAMDVMVIRPQQGVAVTIPGGVAVTNPGEEGCVPLVAHDLVRHTSRELPEFGDCIWSFDLDPSGRVLVAANADGVVRVGLLAGGEPHLLVGHKGRASVAVSPDLKWVASAGDDGTLRLWPMPDLDRPPLHTLPRPDLVAKLESLTNLRAVRDAKAASGWAIRAEPFPGWKVMPTWDP